MCLCCIARNLASPWKLWSKDKHVALNYLPNASFQLRVWCFCLCSLIMKGAHACSWKQHMCAHTHTVIYKHFCTPRGEGWTVNEEAICDSDLCVLYTHLEVKYKQSTVVADRWAGRGEKLCKCLVRDKVRACSRWHEKLKLPIWWMFYSCNWAGITGVSLWLVIRCRMEPFESRLLPFLSRSAQKTKRWSARGHMFIA